MKNKIKKIMALFIVSMFVISMLPAALAEEDNSVVVDGSDVTVERVETVDAVEVDMSEQDKVSDEEKPIKRKRFLQKIRTDFKKVKQDYKVLKTNYVKSKKEFKEQKSKLTDLRKDLVTCKELGEECDEKRLEIRSAIKEHLISTAGVVLSALEKLENRIINAENIEDDVKEEVLADISEKKANIETAVEKVESLTKESTPEEIREAVKELKKSWQEARPVFKWSVGKLINARLSHLLENLETTSERLDNKISSLEENGFDIDELTKLADQFDENVEIANNYYEKAKSAYENADSASDMNQLAKEIHELQGQAREHIKESKQILREIFQAMKDLQDQETDLEVDVEEIDENQVEDSEQDEVSNSESDTESD